MKQREGIHMLTAPICSLRVHHNSSLDVRRGRLPLPLLVSGIWMNFSGLHLLCEWLKEASSWFDKDSQASERPRPG